MKRDIQLQVARLIWKSEIAGIIDAEILTYMFIDFLLDKNSEQMELGEYDTELLIEMAEKYVVNGDVPRELIAKLKEN